MSFIEEVRSIKTEYILRDEIKEKIIAEAKKDKKYIEISAGELNEYDVKALEKEGFTIEKRN